MSKIAVVAFTPKASHPTPSYSEPTHDSLARDFKIRTMRIILTVIVQLGPAAGACFGVSDLVRVYGTLLLC